MSDQADLNKVIEDVLLEAFDDKHHHQEETNQHGLDKKLDDEIDYNEQLASLLGGVEAHSKEHGSTQDIQSDEPHHQQDKAQDEGDEYQIDFANVVQGIMDQYGDEERQEYTEHEEVPPESVPQIVSSENSTTDHDKIDDSINKVVNDVTIKANESEGIKTEEIEHEEEDDENDFQNILAQLASEAVDKVRGGDTEVVIDSHHPADEEEVPAAAAVVASADSTLKQSSVPEVAEELETKDKDNEHEKELKDAIANALLSTDLNQLQRPEINEIVRKEEDSKSRIVAHAPAQQAQPLQKSKIVRNAPEPPLKPQQQQQEQHEAVIAPEGFLGELEKLAGVSDETDDLQAAFAQMVRNVVEGNESVSDSYSDDSLSDSDTTNDDGLPMDQSQMNEILHNAFQLAMDQQSAENDQLKDVNLNQHKAALDDAISTLFTGDRSKLKQLPKPKKEVTSITKKKQEKLPAAEPVKTKKVYTKKVGKTVEAAKPNDAVKPTPAPAPAPTAPVVPAAQSKTQIQEKMENKIISEVVPKLAAAAVATSAVSSASSSKKKGKLSIAETLALTRSSMREAPRRDYSNIESLEQVLKVTEKHEAQQQQQQQQQVQAKQPGVTTFQSTAAKKSTLAEAIQQMSNALQSSSTSQSKAKHPTAEKENTHQIHMTQLQMNQQQQPQLKQTPQKPAAQKQQVGKSAITPTTTNSNTTKVDNEKGLLDALLLAKQFMSQQSVKESAAETLNVINSAIESLKKPEVTTANVVTPFNNVTSSSMTAAITQAISNFTGSVSSSRSRSSSRKNKSNSEAPELKEKIRQSNRERKKKWREINAERNKDNDLRFRVVKRATHLFGEVDTEEKTNWIQEELDKRKRKRMERLSHSLKPLDKYDSQSGSESNTDSFVKSSPSVKTGSSTSSLINPTLIKSIMDAFGQRNINSSMASAVAVSAIQALKSNTTDQQQITTAITNAISSITGSLNTQKTAAMVENVAGVPSGAVSSFKIQTPEDFSKQNHQQQQHHDNAMKFTQPDAVNDNKEVQSISKVSDRDSTTLIKTNTSTVIAKPKANIANNSSTTPLLAAAEATRKMMANQKGSGISTSMQNMIISGSTTPFENFTTSKSPQAEKRKSEENLLNEELKKPRSVSPHAAPQLADILKESNPSTKTASPAEKQDVNIKSTPVITRPTMESTMNKLQSHQQDPQPKQPIARRPSISFQNQNQIQNHTKQQQHHQPQPVNHAIIEPFKMAWSSRTAFRLPQYKKPVSDYERSSSATPPPPSSSTTPSTPLHQPSPNEGTTPRRPLQRPGFSKPSAFQRPRW